MLCWETYGLPVFRGCDFPFSATLARTLLCTGTAVSACCFCVVCQSQSTGMSESSCCVVSLQSVKHPPAQLLLDICQPAMQHI